MAEDTIEINVICFGPLVEELGFRESRVNVSSKSTAKTIIIQLNAGKWINAGIKIALNGDFINLDHVITESCELALLPPVSGG